MIDPVNDPDNEDISEVECCRWCRELIEPGTEAPYNGWFYHSHCVPADVIEGREQELRNDERAGK